MLPNFAMTDYALQGKTCPFNVVDLHKCKTHQLLYTCLLQSASVAGTIILQGLSEGLKSKITKGASGALRQEFRELELLDEITGLRFEGTLLLNISGLTRNKLIVAYRKYRGETYVPQYMHVTLRWNKVTPWLAPEPISDIPSTN